MSIGEHRKPIKPGDVIAALALVVACASFVYSVIASNDARVHAAKPVLVFEYTREGWRIHNVGNGPALDILITARVPKDAWGGAVRIPPLATDSSLLLEYLSHTNVHQLGARYADTEGRVYSSICGNDLTTLYKGSRFPDWSETQIGALWQAERLNGAGG